MDPTDDLFAEFPPATRAEWIAQAEKDLRGKPLADLAWQLEEDIVLAPFYHPEDLPDPPASPLAGKRPGWSVGEIVLVRKIDEAAAAVAEAAEGGAEALLLVLYHPLKKGELEVLLEQADLDKQTIHFTEYYEDKDPKGLLEKLYALAGKQGRDASALTASVDFDPMLDWADPPYHLLEDLFAYCREKMPRCRMLQVNGLHLHSGPDNSSAELGMLIAKGSSYLHETRERGIDPADLLPRLQFNVALSTSFFVEVAKLRALRLLWANVLAAYAVEDPPQPLIVAHLARDSQGKDVHHNLIRATTQAMSGVMGGADRLFLRPADFYQENRSSPFTRRMARNMQHILRLESHLGQVNDPGAGSYFIEKLTGKLCEEAWAQFRELEKKGGY